MSNSYAIPIGFVLLVGILYVNKPKHPVKRPALRTAPKSRTVGRTRPKYRPKIRLSSKPPKGIRRGKTVKGKRPKIDRAALMKRIRAMLAKRRKQQQLKAMLKKAKANPLRIRPTPPLSSSPASRPAAAATTSGGKTVVELQTSMGNIKIQLYPKKAPITVANFLQYVRSGHYNGTIFHRVIPNFMIQGGGLTASMSKKPTRGMIKNEADNGLKNDVGTIAMARTSAPHSASAQFFINTKNNSSLNFRYKRGPGWGYCVFGRVIAGMDVVMKISGTKTGYRARRANVPLTPITINKAVVLK